MALTSDCYLAQVELAAVSLVAADNIVNTFALRDNGGTADFPGATTAFDSFYQYIQARLSSTLSSATNAHKVKYYRLTDPQPRPPVALGSFTQTGTGTPLPAEVAICSSFAAAPGAGQVPARRRGRVFLGPLNSSAGEVVGSYLRPSAATRTTIAGAMEELVQNLATAGFALSVWSRVDNDLFQVESGWINDEFDTMRSRGPETTDRTAWSMLV